jgi:hypothetical protein
MPWWIYVAAYFDACIVGGVVVAVYLYVMRGWFLATPQHRRRFFDWLTFRPPFFDWLAFLGGAIERAVALTLVLWAAPYLPPFIGGWVLLKFAIGWQREKYGEEVAKGSFLALTGSVLSFAIAIGVGVALNPAALDIWAAPHG